MPPSEIPRTRFVRFATTRWTDIVGAQVMTSQSKQEFLDQFVERYWRPVYVFIRQRGSNRDDALDLTQQFFASFLERQVIRYADEDRGKFRTFLLASVKQFLASEYRKQSRKRSELLALDDDEAIEALSFEAPQGETPESAFERNWAKCLIETAVERLYDECAKEDRRLHFRVFEAKYLRESDLKRSYRSIALEFAINEHDVDNLLRWAKVRFRKILLEEVGVSTSTRGEISEEIQALIACLGSN